MFEKYMTMDFAVDIGISIGILLLFSRFEKYLRSTCST